MDFKKFLEHSNSTANWKHKALDSKQQAIIDYLCKNADPSVSKNFQLVNFHDENLLLGYRNVIGISKYDGLFVRSLMYRMHYQSPISYDPSEFIEDDIMISIRKVSYLKKLISIALEIAGEKKKLLFQIPESKIGPILFFSKKAKYAIFVAPATKDEKEYKNGLQRV
ncbi:MAG: hypothetical protein R6U96_08055 [Promethearchaeia archaeon]